MGVIFILLLLPLWASAAFIPFAQYLDNTQNATYKDYANTNVTDDKSFDEMKAHIFTMYGGVKDPKSIKSFLKDKEYRDCLPYLQQPTIHVLNLTAAELEVPPEMADPTWPKPDKDVAQDASESLLRLTNSTDQYSNRMKCTKGTVPIRRLSLERMTRFGNLTDFFAKPGGASISHNDTSSQPQRRDVPRGPDGIKHIHEAVGEANPTGKRMLGASSVINIWTPGSASFSISQFWVLSDSPLQSVEVGWQKYPDRLDGDWESQFFLYHTTKSYESCKGCYGTDCAGFVQEGDMEDGDGFGHYSRPGTANQWEFIPVVKLEGRRWNVYLVRQMPWRKWLVGWYPRHIFDRYGGTLWKGATRIEWGGEVSDAKHFGRDQFGPMGSGQLASAGFGFAAYQRQLQVASDTGAWRAAELIDPTPSRMSEDRQGCYSGRMVLAPAGGTWGAQQWFGGPGGDFCDRPGDVCTMLQCPAACRIYGDHPCLTCQPFYWPECCSYILHNDQCARAQARCARNGCR